MQDNSKILQEGEFHEGYKYVILIPRVTLPFICGYVSVPEDHPLYNRSYNDEPLDNIDVHGGLTFSGKLHDDNIKNITQKNNYYFGFDCFHLGDGFAFDLIDPDDLTVDQQILFNENKSSKIYSLSRGEEYKTEEFAYKECQNLFNQLKSLE